MTDLTKVRREELTRYVELLVHLKANGINCDKKIEEALDELHSNMITAKVTLPNFDLNPPYTTSTWKPNSDNTTVLLNGDKESSPFDVFG